MSEVQFFQTKRGRQFYEATVPELVRQLARLNDLLALVVESPEKVAQPQGDSAPPHKPIHRG